MCQTPYCYGDCEDCIADDKEREEYEEMSKSCPHRKECKLSMINIKLDQCTYCGKTFEYYKFKPKIDMLYCIRIERELEEVMIQHERFDIPPTDEDILDYIDTLDINYKPEYGKFEYYPVA